MQFSSPSYSKSSSAAYECPMYLLHLLIFMDIQSSLIPLMSSSLLRSLTSRLINSLSSCQMFSIVLASGDSGGVFHQLTCFSCRNFCARLQACFRWLSCMNLCPSGNVVSKTGISVASNISVYKAAFIFPSKIQIDVAPRTLISAHTWTFSGCLALHK